MESTIDERIVDWFSRADSQWVSEHGTIKAFDIGRRIQFLTVDIITKLGLGRELGCVQTDSDRYDFLATVQQGNTVCQHFSVLLELNTLRSCLAELPIIGSLITPKAKDESGVGKILGVSGHLHKYPRITKLTLLQIVQKALETRKSLDTKGDSTFVDLLLEHGLPDHEINAEMVITLSVQFL